MLDFIQIFLVAFFTVLVLNGLLNDKHNIKLSLPKWILHSVISALVIAIIYQFI